MDNRWRRFGPAAVGELPHIWTICASDLPPSLWLDADSGGIAGIPELVGSGDFTVMVTDGRRRAARRKLSLNVFPQLVYITTGNLEPAFVEQEYLARIEATGGTPPYFFSLELGSLPDRLRLDAEGRISGAVSGDYRGSCPREFVFRIRAEDQDGNYDIAEFRLSVLDTGDELTIITENLPRGNIAADYRAVLEASGGVEPYSWSFAGLPAELSGSREGVISGIPLTTETCLVEVTVTDQNDRTARADLNLTVGEVSGVQGVISAPGDAKAGLAWQNPGGGEFAEARVLRKMGTYPENPSDGEVVYAGTADNIVDDRDLINGVTYFYAVIAYDREGYPAAIDDNALTSVTPRAVRLSGPHNPYADRVAGYYPLSDYGFGPAWVIGGYLNGDNDEIKNNIVALRPGAAAEPSGVYILLEGGGRGRVSSESDGEINFSNPYSYSYGFAGINPVFSNNGSPDPTDPAVSGGDFFDLGDLPGRPWTWIRYVRITSTGDHWRRGESGNLVRHTPVAGALSGVGSSGFDLDAACAINY